MSDFDRIRWRIYDLMVHLGMEHFDGRPHPTSEGRSPVASHEDALRALVYAGGLLDVELRSDGISEEAALGIASGLMLARDYILSLPNIEPGSDQDDLVGQDLRVVNDALRKVFGSQTLL